MKFSDEKKEDVINFVHMYFMKSCKLEIFDKIESLIWIFWKGPSCLIPVKVISLLQGSMYLDMLFKSLGDYIVRSTVTIHQIIQGKK